MLLSLLKLWVLKASIKGNYGGIQLSDTATKAKHSDEFVIFTIQALRLIERTDPRRFSVVQQELRYISNIPQLSGASFRRSTRECAIDFLRYQSPRNEPGYEWYLAQYACIIIHESTHGRIYRFGIPYNDKTWLRVERLCHKEAQRFARHLLSDEYNFSTLLPKFDPTWWRNYRALTKLDRTRQLLARFREVDAARK